MLHPGGDTRMSLKEPLSDAISLVGLLHQTDRGKDLQWNDNVQSAENGGEGQVLLSCCLA